MRIQRQGDLLPIFSKIGGEVASTASLLINLRKTLLEQARSAAEHCDYLTFLSVLHDIGRSGAQITQLAERGYKEGKITIDEWEAIHEAFSKVPLGVLEEWRHALGRCPSGR